MNGGSHMDKGERPYFELETSTFLTGNTFLTKFGLFKGDSEYKIFSPMVPWISCGVKVYMGGKFRHFDQLQ